MNRYKRIYYYAILGAIGGLISWQISNLVSLSLLQNIYLSELVVGGLIGFCFGALIGFAEGVFRHHVKNAGLENTIEIDSAGTIGFHVGNPPDSRAGKNSSSASLIQFWYMNPLPSSSKSFFRPLMTVFIPGQKPRNDSVLSIDW